MKMPENNAQPRRFGDLKEDDPIVTDGVPQSVFDAHTHAKLTTAETSLEARYGGVYINAKVDNHMWIARNLSGDNNSGLYEGDSFQRDGETDMYYLIPGNPGSGFVREQENSLQLVAYAGGIARAWAFSGTVTEFVGLTPDPVSGNTAAGTMSLWKIDIPEEINARMATVNDIPPRATELEAEGMESDAAYMTPVKTGVAINKLLPPFAEPEEAQAGTAADRIISPLTLKSFFDYMALATVDPARVYNNGSIVWITPALNARSIYTIADTSRTYRLSVSDAFVAGSRAAYYAEIILINATASAVISVLPEKADSNDSRSLYYSALTVRSGAATIIRVHATTAFVICAALLTTTTSA